MPRKSENEFENMISEIIEVAVYSITTALDILGYMLQGVDGNIFKNGGKEKGKTGERF